MDKDFSRIVWLLQQDWADGLADNEKKELEEMLEDKTMRRVYEEISRESFIASKYEEYQQYSSAEAYRRFSEPYRTKRKIGKRLWMVSAVAAMLVVCIGVAIVLENRVATTESVVAGELVIPGSRKAILRLADGECIKIEGTSMKIKENRGTKIQYSNGQLTYQGGINTGELVYNEVIVPLAGECFIVLDDGTKVWMNSASKLKYPIKFNGKERKVFLEGEAYFDVTKDSKPFIVNTFLGEIQVLGTSFDVKAYRENEKVWTTLVSGRVSFAGKETLQIEPGQQIVALKDGMLIKREVEVEEYAGWKDGLFVFKDQRLEDIMRDLSRWYDIRVFFRQESLKDIQFTGNLKRYDSVDVLLKLLKTTNELNYSITGNTVILYK